MNIIFDFDGTICDSLDTVVGIVNRVLVRYKIAPITAKEIREKGVLHILKVRKVPKFLVPVLLIYGRYKFAKSVPGLKVFDSLDELIIELSKRHTLGIVTSNSKSNVERFINNNFKVNPFKFIHSETSFFNKDKRIKEVMNRYNLIKDKTVHITDEERDVASCKRIGIKCIAVTWGFESKQVLKKSNPDFVVDNSENLFQIINKLSFS